LLGIQLARSLSKACVCYESVRMNRYKITPEQGKFRRGSRRHHFRVRSCCSRACSTSPCSSSTGKRVGWDAALHASSQLVPRDVDSSVAMRATHAFSFSVVAVSDSAVSGRRTLNCQQRIASGSGRRSGRFRPDVRRPGLQRLTAPRRFVARRGLATRSAAARCRRWTTRHRARRVRLLVQCGGVDG
jgi:hypothetical protein